MALRRKRETVVRLLLLALAFGCGARTTLGPGEVGAEQTLGGRSSTQSTTAGGGVVVLGGSGMTEDPPPICFIGSKTYRNHETNPLNPCESCVVLRSRSTWTLEPNCTTADAGVD